jgi:hypothetical protein
VLEEAEHFPPGLMFSARPLVLVHLKADVYEITRFLILAKVMVSDLIHFMWLRITGK